MIPHQWQRPRHGKESSMVVLWDSHGQLWHVVKLLALNPQIALDYWMLYIQARVLNSIVYLWKAVRSVFSSSFRNFTAIFSLAIVTYLRVQPAHHWSPLVTIGHHWSSVHGSPSRPGPPSPHKSPPATTRSAAASTHWADSSLSASEAENVDTALRKLQNLGSEMIIRWS